LGNRERIVLKMAKTVSLVLLLLVQGSVALQCYSTVGLPMGQEPGNAVTCLVDETYCQYASLPNGVGGFFNNYQCIDGSTAEQAIGPTGCIGLYETAGYKDCKKCNTDLCNTVAWRNTTTVAEDDDSSGSSVRISYTCVILAAVAQMALLRM
jgi:hypothetical protein